MKFKISKRAFSLKTGVGGIFLVVVVVIPVLLWTTRHIHAQAPAPPAASDLPSAGVAKVVREDLHREITIPAEFRPYEEVELHAKVSGYVKEMNVDFGDKVTNGELLATLEVPELHDELHNAMAVERKAEADYTNANLIYTRLLGVNREHPDLVAQQDLDTAQANDLATAAAIAEAKAEVEKFQTLVAYTKITAPFDGVITRRYADPGALIEAGTSTDTTRPLVRVSDNYRLRLDFPVTVDYVKDIHSSDPVQVRVDSLNGRTFTGKILRFTDDVNGDTRTMTTEIEVANPDLKLVPGMYATVVLQVEKRPQVLTVPTEAVMGGKTPMVYVVSQENEIEERTVKLGLETPERYEVLSGLHAGDLVVIGNRSRLQSGEKVEPKLVQLSVNDEN